MDSSTSAPAGVSFARGRGVGHGRTTRPSPPGQPLVRFTGIVPTWLAAGCMTVRAWPLECKMPCQARLPGNTDGFFLAWYIYTPTTHIYTPVGKFYFSPRKSFTQNQSIIITVTVQLHVRFKELTKKQIKLKTNKLTTGPIRRPSILIISAKLCIITA